MKLINTLLLLLVTVAIVGQESSIIAENAKVIQAGTGYAFTEGPAVSPDGKVFFTDQPNDRIYAWDETRELSRGRIAPEDPTACISMLTAS